MKVSNNIQNEEQKTRIRKNLPKLKTLRNHSLQFLRGGVGDAQDEQLKTRICGRTSVSCLRCND